MKDRDDRNPLDLIAEGNPLPNSRVPGPEAETGQRVFAGVASRVALVRRRRRIRTASILVIAALALVAAGVYLSRPPTQVDGVTCYSESALDAHFAVAVPDGGGTGQIGDCVPIWMDGTLTNPDVDVTQGVPHLVACVSTVGRLMVFPSEDADLCRQLGLAALADKTGGVSELEGIAEGLVYLFAGDGCTSFDVATSEVESLLSAAQGGEDWVVDAGIPTEDRPCASYAIDGEARTITLVPIPRPPG